MINELDSDSEIEIEKETAFLEKVRRRAYELWLQDGQPHGKDQHYWFQSELEISEEEGRSPPSELDFPHRAAD